MSDHPRWFVEHEQIIILEQDPKRDWFGFRIGGLWGGPMDDDALAGFQGGRGFDGKIVDADMALVNEALHRAARERGESGGQPGVEPLLGARMIDDQDGLRGFSFHHRTSPDARTRRLKS